MSKTAKPLKKAKQAWDDVVDRFEEATGQHQTTADRFSKKADSFIDDAYIQARELLDTVTDKSDKAETHSALRGLRDDAKDMVSDVKDLFSGDDHQSNNSDGFLKAVGDFFNHLFE